MPKNKDHPLTRSKIKHAVILRAPGGQKTWQLKNMRDVGRLLTRISAMENDVPDSVALAVRYSKEWSFKLGAIRAYIQKKKRRRASQHKRSHT